MSEAPRKSPPTYRDIESMPRLVPGTEPRQRPADQEVKTLAEKQEDTVYHRFHMVVDLKPIYPSPPLTFFIWMRCMRAPSERHGVYQSFFCCRGASYGRARPS